MFSRFLLTVLTAVPLLALPVSSAPGCSQTDFKACTDELNVLSNNRDLSFAATEQELTKLCGHLNETMQCVYNYTSRCYDDRHREMYRAAFSGTEQLLSDLCTRGSDFRSEYLRHSACYKSVSSEYQKCSESYTHGILGQESTAKPDMDVNDKLKKSCCLLDGYKDCTKEVVLSKCGPEAAKFGVQFVTRSGSPVAEALCASLKRDSRDCSFPSSGLSSTSYSSMHNFYLSLLVVITTLYYVR